MNFFFLNWRYTVAITLYSVKSSYTVYWVEIKVENVASDLTFIDMLFNTHQ